MKEQTSQPSTSAKTRRMLLLTTVLVSGLLAACATSVQRVSENTVKDVSGRWNDTDSRLVAEEMVSDCISRPWIAQAEKNLGHTPTVIVGEVANNSSEHIATDTFIEDLQRSLINSGRVSFVASSSERQAVRKERQDQDSNASDDTRKERGQEAGADFMLSGTISSIIDKEGGEAVVFYQVNLKLLSMKNNAIVWSGQKKLKKFVKRANVGL